MSKKKRTPVVPRCALCKGVINILGNDHVVGSTGRMVCRGCLQTSFHILEASDEAKEEAVPAPSITPQHIVQELDKSIIGQEQAKAAGVGYAADGPAAAAFTGAVRTAYGRLHR